MSANPCYEQGRIGFETLTVGIAESVVELLFEWRRDEFVLYAWAQLVALGIDVVVENGPLHIAKVLVAQRFQQCQGSVKAVGIVFYECFDDFPIAPRDRKSTRL